MKHIIDKLISIQGLRSAVELPRNVKLRAAVLIGSAASDRNYFLVSRGQVVENYYMGIVSGGLRHYYIKVLARWEDWPAKCLKFNGGISYAHLPPEQYTFLELNEFVYDLITSW